MISSQRLLILLLAINFMTGIAVDIWHSPYETNQNQLNYETGMIQDFNTQQQSDAGTWGAVKRWFNNNFQDITFGNPVKWGAEIAKILWNGINPFSFTPDDFNTTVEQNIASILVFFRLCITLIAGLEIYLLIFNRKQT